MGGGRCGRGAHAEELRKCMTGSRVGEALALTGDSDTQVRRSTHGGDVES